MPRSFLDRYFAQSPDRRVDPGRSRSCRGSLRHGSAGTESAQGKPRDGHPRGDCKTYQTWGRFSNVFKRRTQRHFTANIMPYGNLAHTLSLPFKSDRTSYACCPTDSQPSTPVPCAEQITRLVTWFRQTCHIDPNTLYRQATHVCGCLVHPLISEVLLQLQAVQPALQTIANGLQWLTEKQGKDQQNTKNG